MTLLQYVHLHPWWTLVYLLVIASVFDDWRRS